MTALLAISGSLRAGSTNTKLIHEAIRAFAPDSFAIGDIRFPLYDADQHKADGIPAAVSTLATQIIEADAVLISTPEYNKNLPGGLKNALDWLSMTGDAPLKDKPVAIMSAAAGKAGGERGQYSLRHCLTPLFPRVLTGPEVTIPHAREAFDDDGRLKSEDSFEFLSKLMNALRDEIARGR